MNLLVDIGNSRIKWAVADAAGIRSGKAALLNESLETILHKLWRNVPKPERIVVSNVKGAVIAQALRDWSAKHWSVDPMFIRPERRSHGVINRYRQPEQLGSDRWAAIIGARSLLDRAFCVVDCGTAVTIDGVTHAGEFVGGVILPGLRLARECLIRCTSAIAEGKSHKVCFPGQLTSEAVQIGTLLAVVGGVERSVDAFRALLGDAMLVYLTGGDADQIVERLRVPVECDPELVLRGLSIFASSEDRG